MTTNGVRCFICGDAVSAPDENAPYWVRDYPVCDSCQKTYPPSLIKACRDDFHYTLRIRGMKDEVEFTNASINGSWVTIYDRDNYDGVVVDSKSYLRGYDIRVEEIIGCSDAPDIPFSIRNKSE